MVPRGLEPRTLRLLAVRSNQLSYETRCTIPLESSAIGKSFGCWTKPCVRTEVVFYTLKADAVVEISELTTVLQQPPSQVRSSDISGFSIQKHNAYLRWPL